MNAWSEIANGAARAASGVVVDTARGISDIVERWAPSAEKKAEMAQELMRLVNQSAASARAYDPRSTAAGKVSALINVCVDAINRSIRPAVTIGLIGGSMGWWSLPPPDQIDPVFLAWTENVVIFWFGGRVLFKDLPAVIAHIASVLKK